VFNVAINGTPVLTSLDIYAQADDLTALDQVFPATCANGQITTSFTQGSPDGPFGQRHRNRARFLTERPIPHSRSVRYPAWMEAVELLWKGLAAGVAIAAPVGPVNVLVVSRTIEKGWMSGLVCGVGAALEDTLYGAIAGFSITYVINFLLREQRPIKIVGGLLLVAIAVVYSFKKPATLHGPRRKRTDHSDLVSTLLLTLTNPTTVLSYLVVLSALGIGGGGPVLLNSILVGGIFAGSMAWWTILSGSANRLRHRFTDHTMALMDRIAALAIGGFGIFTLVSGLLARK
jgi:threonine/homoserine/homoserine lactone efflux protein